MTRAPDWTSIDTVLLDMDGTILDLKFDNQFWMERVPAHYAAVNSLSVAAAKAEVEPLCQGEGGHAGVVLRGLLE